MVPRESSRWNHGFVGGLRDSWVHVGREGQRDKKKRWAEAEIIRVLRNGLPYPLPLL